LATRVTMPVLIIHGAKDRNAPYGAGLEWAQMLTNARLITLKKAAHNSWADEGALLLTALRSFLGGSWPASAERVPAPRDPPESPERVLDRNRNSGVLPSEPQRFRVASHSRITIEIEPAQQESTTTTPPWTSDRSTRR
jgi:hypothetical protein